MYTPQSNWERDVLRLYGNMMAKEIPHCDFFVFFLNLQVFVLLLRICYTILRGSKKACLFDVRPASALI